MRRQFQVILLSLIFALPVLPQSSVVVKHRGGAPSTPSFVQSCTNDKNSAGASNLTCTWGAGVTSGNGAVVYVFWSAATAPSPATGDISDASSDTFTYITSLYNGVDQAIGAMYLAATVTASTTVATFNCSARTATLNCVGFEGIVAFEVHGGSRASDGFNSRFYTGASSANFDACTAFSTTVDGDLLVMGATDVLDNSTTFSAGTTPITFTVPANGRSANLLATMEYGVQTTHNASTNPAFTGNVDSHGNINVCMGIN
jgi:hypothetical protein